MTFRFNIQDAVYDNNAPTLCQPTVQSDYDGISGGIFINGENAIGFINLGVGLIHPPFPFTAGGVTVNGAIIENGLFVALDIEVENLWDSVDIRVTLNQAGFLPLDRTFTVFGYDIGRNPNIPATAINPEMYLVKIPATFPDATATVTFFPAIGVEFRIDADNPGAVGNGITLGPGNGVDSMQDLMAAWNLANPNNTGTLTQLQGGLYVPSALEGTFGPTAGGTDSPIANVAYANFVGWRRPFKNDLYLYANYSNIQDSAEYKDIDGNLLAETHTALLRCYNGPAINLTSTVFDDPACCCGGTPQIADTCTFGDLTFETLVLIPTFSCEVTCENCCEDGCLVTINDNYAQFIIDVSQITPLNVDDVEIVSVEELTIQATVYSACGDQISTDSAVISLNPVPGLTETRVPVVFPESGDYAVKCEILSEAFVCEKTHAVKGCHRYEVEKTECNKHVFKNLSLDEMTISVQMLNKDKQWDVISTDTVVASCSTYEITTDMDGVYRITVDGEEYKVFIVDCTLKACFVDYTKKRVCNPKADCACGGNCNGLCKKVPQDLYDFTAFGILVYNYLALINGLYIKNYIFTVFQPSDLDRLFSVTQYLERIKEYCGNCEPPKATTNNGTCGCNK